MSCFVAPQHVSSVMCVAHKNKAEPGTVEHTASSHVYVGMYEFGTPRTGAIGKAIVDNGTHTISLQSTVPAPPVFDVVPWVDENILCVSCADATVRLYDLDTLKEQARCDIPHDDASDAMCTFVSRSPGLDKFAVTMSSGHVAVVPLLGKGAPDMDNVSYTVGHEAEAWTCAFLSDRQLATGADDAMCKLWAIDGGDIVKTSTLRHDAGVTSVVKHPTDPNYILTGSYDDNVRCWDLRQLRQPLFKHNVGGGVWRISPRPGDPSLLALAGMYSGAHIVRFDLSSGFVTVSTLPPESDKTLQYGLDWLPDGSAPVLGSHYDNVVQVWTTLGV